MKIRFVQEHKVQQGDGRGPHYKVGDVVEFNGMVGESYGRKYVARGYAEEVKAGAAPAAPAPVAEAPAPAPAAAPQPEPAPRRRATNVTTNS